MRNSKVVLSLILVIQVCMLSACANFVSITRQQQTNAQAIDSNGLDELSRNGFHVQNVRMVLAALASIEHQNTSEARAHLYELLYSELSLLNGFDPISLAKPVHKGLCVWRQHLSAAKHQLLTSDKVADVQSKRSQFERTEQLLEGVCRKP